MFQCFRIRSDTLEQHRHRSIETDTSAVQARAGSNIHEPVRVIHGLGIMFHDHDGVSLVAQFFQGIYQLAVVALMETDTRFVQDIKDIDQLGTDLRGKPDALALTS